MLTWFEVESFKSIKKLHLDLQPFMVLVGANAAGKTNIVQALSVFLDILAEGDTTPLELHGGFEQLWIPGQALSAEGKGLPLVIRWMKPMASISRHGSACSRGSKRFTRGSKTSDWSIHSRGVLPYPSRSEGSLPTWKKPTSPIPVLVDAVRDAASLLIVEREGHDTTVTPAVTWSRTSSRGAAPLSYASTGRTATTEGAIEIGKLWEREYLKTTHGPRLFEQLRLEDARRCGKGQRGSRSLDKLLRTLGL